VYYWKKEMVFHLLLHEGVVIMINELWEKYKAEEVNWSIFPEKILEQGKTVKFAAQKMIVSRGEFPNYLYFIKSGKTVGSREYADGNEYNYFQLDQSNGNIGLLEILAQKNEYVATVMCITEVEVLRIAADIIYAYIMETPEMLRRCITFVARDLYMRSGNDGILYYLSGINRLRYYLINYYEARKDRKSKVVVEDEYQDIAKKIGTSVRTVGRSIRILKDNKEILSVNKKCIITEEKRRLMAKKLWS
jgi:CRP-like cAMP-binding protein